MVCVNKWCYESGSCALALGDIIKPLVKKAIGFFNLPEWFFVCWVNGDDSNQKFIFVNVIMHEVREFLTTRAADIIITHGSKEGVALNSIKGELQRKPPSKPSCVLLYLQITLLAKDIYA